MLTVMDRNFNQTCDLKNLFIFFLVKCWRNGVNVFTRRKFKFHSSFIIIIRKKVILEKISWNCEEYQLILVQSLKLKFFQQLLYLFILKFTLKNNKFCGWRHVWVVGFFEFHRKYKSLWFLNINSRIYL